MDEKTYSGIGPKCPHCGFQYTADEPFFYDEQNYTEDMCCECEKEFSVEVFISTSWTCTPKTALKEKKDD